MAVASIHWNLRATLIFYLLNPLFRLPATICLLIKLVALSYRYPLKIILLLLGMYCTEAIGVAEPDGR